MADKERKEEKARLAGQAADVRAANGNIARRHSQKWVAGVVAAVVLVYLLVMSIGFWTFGMWADHKYATLNGMGGNYGNHMMQERGAFNEATFTMRQSDSDGLTTTTTNTTYTQTRGVVTAVNNDSIVVAGGGKAQTIKTNGSTKYVDDIKPKVNDTVVVTGTKDGDALMATQVAVLN